MNMEFNKILAAVLTAGIIAYFAGLTSHGLVHSKTLEEDAYPIEVADAGTVGSVAAAPAGPEPVDIASADLAKGEKLAKVCAACHTFGKSEPNKVGPNLFSIIGAKHAHVDGFAYSEAMKAKAGETWTVEALNEFLFSPKAAVPGTKMVFAGLKKTEDRAALIKYLSTLK